MLTIRIFGVPCGFGHGNWIQYRPEMLLCCDVLALSHLNAVVARMDSAWEEGGSPRSRSVGAG